MSKRHGHASGGRVTPELATWYLMRKRCYAPNSREYPRYGGRGITICSRWNDFAAFYSDMGAKPTPQHSIDRIDVNGPYSPDNCRWALPVVQQNNRTDNNRVTWNGQTKTMSEWARVVGIGVHTLSKRVERWGLDDAMTRPLRADARRHAK